jgi:hypothetical protein
MLIATAVESYAARNGSYPNASSFDELVPMIEPDFISSAPRVDPWGRSYEYLVADDSQKFRVISGGKDQIVDVNSRTIGAPAFDKSDDVVYESRQHDAPPELGREGNSDRQRP